MRGVHSLLDELGPATVTRETDARNLTQVPKQQQQRMDDFTIEVRCSCMYSTTCCLTKFNASKVSDGDVWCKSPEFLAPQIVVSDVCELMKAGAITCMHAHLYTLLKEDTHHVHTRVDVTYLVCRLKSS